MRGEQTDDGDASSVDDGVEADREALLGDVLADELGAVLDGLGIGDINLERNELHREEK